MRHLVFELHPVGLDTAGIEAALGAHLSQLGEMEDGPGYHVHAQLTREPSPAIRSLLYRVIQEAIRSAREHARASNVELSLVERDNGFLATSPTTGSVSTPGKAPAVPPVIWA